MARALDDLHRAWRRFVNAWGNALPHFNDLPRLCKECGIETAEPVYCWWCSRELGGEDG